MAASPASRPRELPAFRARLAEHDIGPVAVHASYLVNLAGTEEDFFGARSTVLASDLRAAPGFAGRFVNVHIGSHRGAGVAAGIERLADGLALALAEVDDGPDAAMVVLENSPGSGFGLGVDVDGAGGDRRGRRGARRAGAAGRVLPRHGARLGGRDRRLPSPRRSMRSWPISTIGSGSTGW